MFKNRKDNFKLLELLESKIDLNTDNVKLTKIEDCYLLKGNIILINKNNSTTMPFDVSSPIRLREDLSTNEKLMKYFYLIIANECSDYIEIRDSVNKIFTDDEYLFLKAERFYNFVTKALS